MMNNLITKRSLSLEAAKSQTVTTNRIAMQSLGNVTPAPFVPLMGAYPIEIDGEIAGGIAVAGAGTGENDEIKSINNLNMRTKRLLLLIFCLAITLLAPGQDLTKPIVSEELVFDEKNGLAAVEAEYYYKQNKDEIRQWYRTSKNEIPEAGRYDDPQHCFDASNNSYIEILPDTRVSSADKLIDGENFSNVAGQMAVLSYKVNITTSGRYYVWVRAFSTGAEDNGLHVGVDDKWPEHGQRMQWCEGKNMWTWASKQRTESEHCGVPKEIWLDIDKAGIHDVQFSMREDGFEFDKFILTKDVNYIPEGQGPAVRLLTGKVPPPFPLVEADKGPLKN